MVLRSARRAGFTILEILIAIVVLVLGITGIIALFPTAIESGNKTVEDSYAAAITQSVVDALTVGVRESRYMTRTLPGRQYTYFVFNHDGVLDQAPLQPQEFTLAATGAGQRQGAIWRRDFCVILPMGPASNPNVQLEPNFLHPVPTLLPPQDQHDEVKLSGESDPTGVNQRDPTRLAGGGIDNLALTYFRPAASGGARTPWISRTFQLGRYREPPASNDPLMVEELPMGPGGVRMRKGDIRLDYRGDAIISGATTEATIAIDPYPTYSFAFTLQRARIDTNGDGRLDPNTDNFSDSLYTLRVMIFKNFDPQAAHEARPGPTGSDVSIPRTNIPIREFVTLLAL
ncbi:MAG: hypothetical protein M9894_36965 [Planctomycetes bacterium]|nr:hypothetical protein [Planctomycetota bacterium]